jgi:hypothetical protein
MSRVVRVLCGAMLFTLGSAVGYVSDAAGAALVITAAVLALVCLAFPDRAWAFDERGSER